MFCNKMQNVIKRYGFIRVIKGGAKKIRNIFLMYLFRFDKWHVAPIEFREYAFDLCEQIDCFIQKGILPREGKIVEIGCGLGDILAWGGRYKKCGFDLDANVIRCAQVLHPTCRFEVGSFSSLSGMNIDVLVMVNFVHGIEPDNLRVQMSDLLKSNKVGMIVLDIVSDIQKSNYKYTHEGEYLLQNKGFVKIHTSKEYPACGGAKRHIEFWKLM